MKKNQIILLTSMRKKISSFPKFDSVDFIITELRSNGKKKSVLFGSTLSCLTKTTVMRLPRKYPIF